MPIELPAAFRQTDEEAVREEVEAMRGTTMEERARILQALCRLAAEQVAQHPDPARALAWQDPLPPESEALLRRLRAQERRHG